MTGAFDSPPGLREPGPTTGGPPRDPAGDGARGARVARAAELFDAHARDLLAYLTRRVGPDEAEDLLSEAFVVLLGQDRVFDDRRGGARAWLFGVATNLLRRRHRDAVRAEAHRQQAVVAVNPGVTAVHDDVAALAAGRVDAERDARHLAGAVQDLDPRDRDVLLLVAWAGLTAAEVGEALEIPAGTVRSRLNRTRTRLRAAAADPDTDHPDPDDPDPDDPDPDDPDQTVRTHR